MFFKHWTINLLQIRKETFACVGETDFCVCSLRRSSRKELLKCVGGGKRGSAAHACRKERMPRFNWEKFTLSKFHKGA